MSYRKTVLVLVVLALVGVAAYWRWSVASRSGVTPVSSARDAVPLREETSPATTQTPAALPAIETPPAATEEAPAGFVVSGTVTASATGAPLAGAHLAATLRNQSATAPDPPLEAQTDEEGRYSLSLPSGSRVAVMCTADGFATEEETVSGSGGAKVTLDFVLDPGSVILGRVTDISGAALPDIPIVAYLQNGSAGSRKDTHIAVTDPDGAYRCAGVGAGRYTVAAQGSIKDLVPTTETPTIVNVEGGREYPGIDFTLEPGATVTGVVYNPQKEPVKDARVETGPGQVIEAAMQSMRNMQSGERFHHDDTTDDSGAFEVRGLRYDTEYRLAASADGFAETFSQPFRVSRGSGPFQQDIVLSAGSTISGTVRFADGRPAPDQDVTLMAAIEHILSGEMTDPRRTKSAQDGSFSFTAIAAGHYTLAARDFDPWFLVGGSDDPGLLKLDVDGIKPLMGLVVQVGEGEMKKAGTIKGIVLDPAGRPAADAKVTAEHAKLFRGSQQETTGTDGSFVFDELDAGEYDLVATAESGRAEQKAVKLNERVTLHLPPPPTVEGRVVDEEGAPAARCLVSLRKAGGGGDAWDAMLASLGQSEATTQTDSAGAFAFKNVRPGTYTVAARSDTQGTGESQPVTAASGRKPSSVTITLKSGVRVSGNVADKSGRPVGGALVRLIAAEDASQQAWLSQVVPAADGGMASTTTADGAYEVLQVPEGKYLLTASHSGFAPSAPRPITVRSGRELAGQDVVLTAGTRIKGQLLKDGVPQANMTIPLVGPNGSYTLTTDGEGNYDLDHVAPGQYLLMPLDAEILSSLQGVIAQLPEVVEVPEGEDSQLMFPPHGETTVSGSVSGEQLGNIVAVWVRRPGGPAPEDINPMNIGSVMDAASYMAGEALVNSDGTFTIDGLEPGTYIFEVYSANVDTGNLDFRTFLNLDRTPQIRQEITVTGTEPVQLDVTVAEPPR